MSAEGEAADALKRRLAAMPGRLRAAADAALHAIGDDTVAQARRLLAGAEGSSPSQPGETPRDPAGHLAASLSATADAEAATVRIGSTSPQAVFLEYGTRTMAARPFLRPAAAAVRPAALDACRAALAAAAHDERDAR